ncbi:MAG: toxin-antitoxin system YwqK family antitoxin [Bacteroidetes bacterium]|nr:toxin-antitoxin system YwqK family antitoxin [Bacteroidota bacterium]
MKNTLPFRLILVLMFCISAVSVFAQPPAADGYPNKVDDKGRKQGPWRKTDDKGIVVYVGQFKDDQPVGKFTYYDNEGRVMRDMIFRDAKTTYVVLYWINGKKQAEGKYISQQKDSTWRFYDGEEMLLSEENYKAGKKEGLSVTYYAGTNKVFEKKAYKNDLQDGAWQEFYLEGQKKAEGTFVMGNPEGRAVWYYEDGRISIMGNYKKGLKDGVWVFYLRDGKERARQTWKNGDMQGEETLITPEELQKMQQEVQQNGGGEPKPPGGQ